ncbi:unnamed protein product [Didymodactylos carnosus]|uniref:Uncharacterized protein n=1 Tax=Didymodactylos carnosus TaxID=1234261 RepID=A0A8S2Q521_9BILA|nr:unnamed protein product [Didymodactylos carnosus]CAF4081541.1 unnamed protein product [Didymodactylos carnosus]
MSETAKVLVDNLKMCKLLKQNKIYTLKQLSTYISNNLRPSSNVTDNTMIDDDVDNESDTSSSSGNEDNDYYGEDDESENISEGEDDDKIPLDHFAHLAAVLGIEEVDLPVLVLEDDDDNDAATPWYVNNDYG